MTEKLDFLPKNGAGIDDLMKILGQIEKSLFENSNGIAGNGDSQLDKEVNSINENPNLEKKIILIKQLIQYYYFDLVKQDFPENKAEILKTKELFSSITISYPKVSDTIFSFIQKNFSGISEIFQNIDNQQDLKNTSILSIEKCLNGFQNILSQIYSNNNLKDKVGFFNDFVNNSYFLFGDLESFDLNNKVDNLFSLKFFKNSFFEENIFSTKLLNIDNSILSKIEKLYLNNDESGLISYIKTSSELSYYRQELLNLPNISKINEKILKSSLNPKSEINLASISKVSDDYSVYSLSRFVDKYKQNPDKTFLDNYISGEFTKIVEKSSQGDFFLIMDFIFDNFINDEEVIKSFEKILKPKENKFKKDFEIFTQKNKEEFIKNPDKIYYLSSLRQTNYKNFLSFPQNVDIAREQNNSQKKSIEGFNKIFGKNSKDVSINSSGQIKILTENKTVKIGENESIEMSENGNLLFINSLGYKFEFENNGFDLENMYILVEKMDYLNKIGLGFFGNDFKNILQIFKETLPIEMVGGLYVKEKQNDFLDFFELDLIISIFKKIGILGNLQNTEFFLPDILKKYDFASNLEQLGSYNFFKDGQLDRQKLKDLLKDKFIKNK